MVTLVFNGIYSQEFSVTDMCSAGKIRAHKYGAKSTVASLEEERYDVRTVHLDIELDNESVAIKGKATTAVEVLEDNFALYVFELNKLLEIDSIFINGVQTNFTREEHQVNVLLPTVFQKGARITSVVYYGGNPEPGSVFFFQSGLNNAPAEAWGSKVTYTLSEPYYSKDWWPCKQSLQDKIDSAKIWITVPDSLKAGSNGVLRNISNMGNGKVRYEWQTNYPTAYYLISVAVANYRDYSFATQLPDGKVVRVQNYIYNRVDILDTFKQRIDTTAEMLYYFSELFGSYPFYEEKYGHCMAPVFGGMEHQTMTTLHNFNSPLVSHELAHQWFGNHVTCATWKDIWLNEGVASYVEYLFAEKFWSADNAYNYMAKVHNSILNDTVLSGSIYVPETDTVNPYRIFDGRLSYQKGSAVLHMLRYVVNDDDVFFNILKQQQIRFADGNITTEQFIQLAEEVSGMDLKDFFQQWIYGEGYPVYTVNWNQLGDRLVVDIRQETVVPSVTLFYKMPLELKLKTTDGDTTVRVENRTPQQTYLFDVNSTIEDIIFDPNNKILNKEKVVKNPAVWIDRQLKDEVVVYPNPTTNEWKVLNILEGTNVVLTDLSGTVLWDGLVDNNNTAVVPASRYPTGVYILHISNADKQLTSKKLVKL